MKPTAKRRRSKPAAARARRDAANLTAAGGRHRIDVSERETVEISRLHRPLAGASAAINAQLQTPEAWAWVWREE